MTYLKTVFGKQNFYFLIDYTETALQIANLMIRFYPTRIPSEVIIHNGPSIVSTNDKLTELCVNSNSVWTVHFKVQIGLDEFCQPVYLEFFSDQDDQDTKINEAKQELQARVSAHAKQLEEEEELRKQEEQKAAFEAAQAKSKKK